MSRLFSLPAALLLTAPILATGCDTEGKDASGNAAVTRADVDALEPDGDGQGVVFSGIWTMKTEVTKTNCDLVNLVDALPLPSEGDEDEEQIELVHKQGDLSRPSSDLGESVVGDSFVFHGQFNANRSFTYGQIFEIEIAGQTLRRTEIVEGTLSTDDGGTMTATANRRYEAGSLVDCSADVKITATRSLTGGGGEEEGETEE